MSKDDDKERRSKRLSDTAKKVKRQVKIAKMSGVEVEEPHKYAKMHALNCGNPDCVMCANPRKTFKQKTIQELRFEETEDWSEE